MPQLNDILFNAQLSAVWVLILCLLIESYLPWPAKYHPLSFIQALANGMATKVLKPESQSFTQQKISGSLALVVILLPLAAILAVLSFLAQFPMFFDSLMLLIALRFQPLVKQTQKVSQALLAEKKMLARHELSHIVLRDTQSMSPMGLVKANIESLLLRYSFETVAVIFWYCLTGGLGALIYRMLYQISLSWNIKHPSFSHFGTPLRTLLNLLQWLPNKIAVLSILIAVNISFGVKAIFKTQTWNCEHIFMLNSCGASLGIELGGPAIYKGNKVRIPRCGGTRQVVLADNARVLSALQRATWVTVIGVFVISVLLVA
ncbi:cobalamin biosynthesis protein CobD/CbiB [Paraglaciecola aestuariivivens]